MNDGEAEQDNKSMAGLPRIGTKPTLELVPENLISLLEDCEKFDDASELDELADLMDDLEFLDLDGNADERSSGPEIEGD